LHPSDWCPGGRVLSDAEALTALLFDECENYAPHANCNYSAACIKGMLHCNKCGFIELCPTCGGSGQTPKDGVDPRFVGNERTPVGYFIDAEMLEGDG
jgi:hypothetical protein